MFAAAKKKFDGGVPVVCASGAGGVDQISSNSITKDAFGGRSGAASSLTHPDEKIPSIMTINIILISFMALF